ncbi:MAG: serine kinase [Citromicrobium sp.]|nr:MAG: serine kinase [Citromicrobium sp.]
MTMTLANVTGVAIDGRGLLIEGPTGAGKTSLALMLIDRGAVLIGDDGVQIAAEDGQLVASPAPETAGLIEIRNVGIVEMPTTSAPVALILSISPKAARFPMDTQARELCGLSIPSLPFRTGDAAQAIRAEFCLLTHGLALSSDPRKTVSSER